MFPKWTNHLPTVAAAGLALGAGFVTFVVWFYFSPENTDVGYAPDQPVLYSHRLHAGQMGMDCRYCHTSVELGPHANVPPTETCMNCHKTVHKDRPEIQKIAAAHAEPNADLPGNPFKVGEPLRWKKVHLLPDYAYFNHAAHVRVGVGCASCHGRVDQMDVVRQVEPLSMGWCLECHRDPEAHIRPPDQVTNMDYVQSPEDFARAERLVDAKTINPPTHCSACHR